MNNHTPLSRRIIRSLAVPAVAGLLAFAASAPTALADSAGCSTDNLSSYAANNSTPSCWRPYNNSSPFNTPLPSNPTLAPNSSGEIGQLDSDSYHFDGSSSQYQFDSQGSRAVYFSNNSDPLVTINCTAYWGPNTCQGWNGIPIDNIQIHIPSGAQPETAWDHHMTIIDSTTGTEYDFERASWTSSNVLTVWSGSAIPVDGPQANGLNGGADAADLGLLAGQITASELASGTINHALAISVPCTKGYVWPATGAFGLDCSSISQGSANAMPLGALLQLNMTPAQIAATHAPAWEQSIMRAMATYGMYANDTNGGSDNTSLELEKEADVSFTSVGGAPQMANLVKSLGGTSDGSGGYVLDGVPIPVNKLRVIAPCVEQGTCPSSGSSSTPPSSPPASTPTKPKTKTPKHNDPTAQTAGSHKVTRMGKLVLRAVRVHGARKHRRHHRRHHSH